MGIRMTQLMGLRSESDQLLNSTFCEVVGINLCPHCKKFTTETLKIEVYDEENGMFDDKVPLHKYFLKEGGVVKEVVQASPWSSGPVIFLCLEDESGNRMFEWDEEDINNA